MIPSYNYSHICQSSWVVVGGAAWMEEVGDVVVGWDRYVVGGVLNRARSSCIVTLILV